MVEDVSDIIIPLALGFLLVCNVIAYRRQWCGPEGMLEIALEEAQAGNTPAVLRMVKRLLARQKKYSAGEIASLVVVAACEWDWPETAQAVLDELGLSRAELMWEREGEPAIPLLEFVQQEPETYPCTIAFLSAPPNLLQEPPSCR